MNFLSLFSGIGGLDLGLERAGMACVGQVEIDEYCRQVLNKHWPDVPQHDDVRTAVAWWTGGGPRRPVHVVAGGFPCQPSSQAGRRMGEEDPRWLWPAMAEVIAGLRPTWVVWENVPGLRTLGLDTVLHDLHRLGYRTRTGVVSACAMGAPHTRSRLFGLAHTAGLRRCPWGHDMGSARATPQQQQDRATPRRGTWWSSEPGVARVAYGLPDRVDRCRVLGNAVVPQVAEHVGRLILDADRAIPLGEVAG